MHRARAVPSAPNAHERQCDHRPVNVALLICVWLPSTKSSALSISKTPPVSGRVADAIKPVTSPVLNRNGVPKAGIAISTAAASTPRRAEGIV